MKLATARILYALHQVATKRSNEFLSRTSGPSEWPRRECSAANSFKCCCNYSARFLGKLLPLTVIG